MALENSLSSTTSLAMGATNPLAPGDNVLWPLILEGLKPQAAEDEKADKKKAEEKGRAPVELFLHVCGGKQTGKSSLIRHLLDEDVGASTADSDMVDYHCRKYGESKSEEPSYLKAGDVLNCWEYSGDEDARDAATRPSSNTMFVRGLSQMKRCVVLIVVDLSKPAEVLPALDFWVRRVQEKCQNVIVGAMDTKNEKIALQLIERAKENFAQRPATGESASDKAAKQPHKDMEKKLIALSGVGVVIVATKSGTFEKEFDPELRKVMINTLRCIAHTNGASLFGLHSLEGNRSGQAAEVKELRAFVEKLLVHGPKAKTNHAVKLSTETNGLLSIPAGEDSLALIGAPKGMDGIPTEELEVAWRALAEKYFPASGGGGGGAKGRRDPRAEWEREHASFSVEMGMNALVARLQDADRAKREKMPKTERPPSTGRSRPSRPTSSSQQGNGPPPPPGSAAPPPRPRSSSKTPRPPS